MLGVCLDDKRIEDIASLPINYSKSSLLLSKLCTLYNMFKFFETSFNLYKEVGRCVNRVWLQVSSAVGPSLGRTEFSTTTEIRLELGLLSITSPVLDLKAAT